jgi:hypothetical protein
VAQGGKRGTARNPQNGYVLPVLSTSDRRAAVLHGRSPFLPFSEHFTVPSTPGSVVVYLDVSGSMLPMLPHLVTLLYEFRDWILKPLWTLDCTVLPARLSDAHLLTRGGGGTTRRGPDGAGGRTTCSPRAAPARSTGSASPG